MTSLITKRLGGFISSGAGGIGGAANLTWIDDFGIIGDGRDELDKMNAVIAAINAGELTGTLNIPEDFTEIAVSAPMDVITAGGWCFASEGYTEARFSLLSGSAQHGRLFKIGQYGGTRVPSWGFVNVGLYNRNFAYDDGSEWALEIENATAGDLIDFHTDGGLGIRHGYRGMLGNVFYDRATHRGNRACGGAAIWGCSGTANGSIIGCISVGFNLLTNASFTSTANWTLSSSAATITGGDLVALGVGSTFTASNPSNYTLMAGTIYSLTIVITNYVAGTLTPQLTGGVTQSGTVMSANTTAAGRVIDITAVSGNTTVTLLFSADANFKVASCILERKSSSLYRPLKIGGDYNDGTIFDNIDAWKIDRTTINQARGNLLQHAIDIDVSKGELGSVNLNLAFAELAGNNDDTDDDESTFGSPLIIHSNNGTQGRLRGLYYTNGRATAQLGQTVPAVQVTNAGGVEMSHVYFRACNFAMSRGPAVTITNVGAPSLLMGVTIENCTFGDRALGTGSPHNVIECGASGVRVIDNKLHISLKGQTLPDETYASRIAKFFVATTDITRLEIRGNYFPDVLDAEGIDISAITAPGEGIFITDNVGPTRIDLKPLHAPYDDGGAAGDGSTDDKAKLQAVLTAGRPIRLDPKKTYFIRSILVAAADNTGIIGNGALIVMDMASGGFTNTDSSSSARYGTNAVGFYSLGFDNIVVENVRIRPSVYTDDRYVMPFAVRDGLNCRVNGNEIWNFSKCTRLIAVDDMLGGHICDNIIYNCSTNSATTGQITGIGVDVDAGSSGSSGVGSDGIVITGNDIRALTNGATFIAIGGGLNYQTTGIHVASSTGAARKGIGFVVENNRIENCAQGIDFYCNDSVINGNFVLNTVAYGIALKHGASRNIVSGNDIKAAGRAAITLVSEDSNNFTQDCADNMVFGNKIWSIDPNAIWAGSSYGIYIPLNDGGTYLARRNKIWDNDIDGNSTGKYGIRAESGAGTLNMVQRNNVTNFVTANYLIDAGVCSIFEYYKPVENYDVLGRTLGSMRATVYSDDFETDNAWTNNVGGGTATRTADITALTAGYVMAFSAANATRWEAPDFFEYDSTKLHKITFRVRRNSGTLGNFSLGVVGYKADRVTRVSTAGTDTYASAHYVAVQGSVQTGIAAGWTEFTGYFTGTSGAPAGTPGTLAVPAALHTNVRIVRPHVIWNNATGDCQIDADSVRIETYVATADIGAQPLDSDLTTIAGLTATTDSFMQAKASAWAARTVAQVKTDLGLTGTNSGDQTSLTGILGGNWKVLYTNGSGVFTEVALGASGTVLTSNGAAVAPTMQVPAGTGDMILASVQTNSGIKTFLDTTLGLRNVANTFTGLFTNAITASRTWTLKDASGTLALTSDITGINSGTNTGDETAAGILAKLITVDGAGSLLDADFLDGFSSAAFLQLTGGTMTGRLVTAVPSATDAGLALTGVATDPSNANIGDVWLNTTSQRFKYRTGAGLVRSLPVLEAANNYTAGVKQTFVSSATTAGANLTPAAAPSGLADGDVWTTTGAFFARINGVSASFAGTNTGDQTITLTGNVTGSGTGTFATTIAAGVVTLAMQANLAANSIIGNNTGAPAVPLALTAAQVKTLLAIANTDVSGLGTLSTQSGTFSGTSSGSNTGDQTITLTGDVTGTGTGSFAATIAAAAVTLAKQANMATASLVYRKTAGAGAPEVNTLATLKTDLLLTGTNSGDQTSIVGIIGTKAQFDTAITDGNAAYVGDLLTADMTGGNWKVFYTNGTGVIIELALGANGTVLTSSGAASAPTFTTPAGSGDMVLANVQTNSGVKTFLDTTMALRNVANTFSGVFTNTITAARTWTLKDASGTIAFTSDITGTNSGTNTGDQTITLTGDVTGTGTGSFAATIGANKVTLAQMAQIATTSFLGRITAATGNVEVLTAANAWTNLGIEPAANFPALTGDVTTVAGALASTIAANAVTNAKAAQMAATTIKGNNTAGVANSLDLTVAQVNTMINSTVAPVFANNTSKPTTLAGYGITDGQTLDADLTTIAGLVATTDNFIQSKASAWASRTVAQVKTDLGLTGTNSGDQLLFSTITIAGQSDVVADLAADTLTLVAGTNITLTTNAATDTITITASGGGTGLTRAEVLAISFLRI